MVQIIQSIGVLCMEIQFSLYIPHGSDNTQQGERDIFEAAGLYIPHGSDNTDTPQICPFYTFLLYIPHGSDNTNLIILRTA